LWKNFVKTVQNKIASGTKKLEITVQKNIKTLFRKLIIYNLIFSLAKIKKFVP
jgi:hypothetical protein